jgi:4-hydroxybenzoate polyprenyltransferase
MKHSRASGIINAGTASSSREMKPTAKLHALAATARIANIPSVLGNVWLGVALAVTTGGGAMDGCFPGRAAVLGLAGVSLYLAGNFLNDWADRDWDAVHRPERALPRALLPAGFYLLVAVGCGVLGGCAAAAISRGCLVVALGIGLGIVIYTRVHKRAGWAVIPMGMCRALLPVLGFVGFVLPGEFPVSGGKTATAALLACACGLFCHIAGLSLSARCESVDPPPVGGLRFARVLFPIAAVAMLVATRLALPLPLAPWVLGLVPYGLWITLCLTLFRQPVSRQVSNLLAGIPLVDWIVLLPLSLALGVMIRPSLFTVICLLFPPLALLAGKFLQKLAPAT